MAFRENLAFLEDALQREYQTIELFRDHEDRISDPVVLAKLSLLMKDTIKHVVMIGEQIIRLREVADGLPMSERKTMSIKPELSQEEMSDFAVDFLKEEETLKVMYKEQAEHASDETLKKVLLSIQKDEVEHVKIVNQIIKHLETKK